MDNESQKYDKLNLDEVELQPPYHFNCVQCGNCCSDKNTIVNLTYSDILRIQWDQNLDFQGLLDIVGFYVFDEPVTEEQIEKMVLPHIETQNGQAFLGLQKNDSGSCIFLNKNNKCRIYKARPDICRTFPFHFHSIPHKDQMEKMNISINYADKAIEFCPGIKKSSPFIDNTRWMVIGKLTLENIIRDAIFIKRWNEAVKSNKVKPIAENYLKIITDFSKSPKKSQKKIGKNNLSYKQRIRKKIPK